jgi:energy-coupling factor transporter ATP-binding protein EcfA2
MRLRLALSAVLFDDAEIVLVDNYAAVGDLEFQFKCRQRIRELAQRGRLVVVASNDLRLLGELADEVLWLEEGRVRMAGPAGSVIPCILDDVVRRSRAQESTTLRAPVEQAGLRLLAAAVTSAAGRDGDLTSAEPLHFSMTLEALSPVPRLRLALTLFNRGKQVLRTVLRDRVSLAAGAVLDATVILPADTLAPGPHEVELTAVAERGSPPDLMKLPSCLRFTLTAPDAGEDPVLSGIGSDHAVAAPRLEWVCASIPEPRSDRMSPTSR